jgi:hypothetical protein
MDNKIPVAIDTMPMQLKILIKLIRVKFKIFARQTSN